MGHCPMRREQLRHEDPAQTEGDPRHSSSGSPYSPILSSSKLTSDGRRRQSSDVKDRAAGSEPSSPSSKLTPHVREDRAAASEKTKQRGRSRARRPRDSSNVGEDRAAASAKKKSSSVGEGTEAGLVDGVAKAQNLRYEDELARKRLHTDHEAQRRHNVELVKMQEESSIRKEQARIATEEQIQAQQRQTEKERAELERETICVKSMADTEGRAHEAKLTEEQNRRMLFDKINGEREKWLAAINTTFGHIEGGVKALLTDRNILIMTIGGATALAAGVYTTLTYFCVEFLF
uniref:ATPase family AAA domain-containing protein n=2 Tax=Brassica campestris TaxID=3711 RepID=M4EH66_BRACM